MSRVFGNVTMTSRNVSLTLEMQLIVRVPNLKKLKIHTRDREYSAQGAILGVI